MLPNATIKFGQNKRAPCAVKMTISPGAHPGASITMQATNGATAELELEPEAMAMLAAAVLSDPRYKRYARNPKPETSLDAEADKLFRSIMGED